MGLILSTTIGQSNSIEIRNNWSGNEWIDLTQQPYMDYVHHPERAVNITAMHEFFHAIQFTMTSSESGLNTSSYKLDNFPLAWLEGTAVLMEDLGFDSVNDYIQYVHDFFTDPTSTILNNNDPYVTGLLAKYLYEKTLDTSSIAFVRTTFFYNDSAVIGFQNNLQATARSLGLNWPHILGSFYTGSYFTGTRSGTGYFVKDSPLLDRWNTDSLSVAPILITPLNNAVNIGLRATLTWHATTMVSASLQHKAVSPYGMNWIRFTGRIIREIHLLFHSLIPHCHPVLMIQPGICSVF